MSHWITVSMIAMAAVAYLALALTIARRLTRRWWNPSLREYSYGDEPLGPFGAAVFSLFFGLFWPVTVVVLVIASICTSKRSVPRLLQDRFVRVLLPNFADERIDRAKRCELDDEIDSLRESLCYVSEGTVARDLTMQLIDMKEEQRRELN